MVEGNKDFVGAEARREPDPEPGRAEAPPEGGKSYYLRDQRARQIAEQLSEMAVQSFDAELARLTNARSRVGGFVDFFEAQLAAVLATADAKAKADLTVELVAVRGKLKGPRGADRAKKYLNARIEQLRK